MRGSGSNPSQLSELEIREKIEAVLNASDFERLKAKTQGKRLVPATPKSAATVDRIIMAAAELLDIAPLRDVSTRSVAQHAGENIATLYRYFDDLESILVELAFRWQSASLFGIKEMTVKGVTTQDREAWVNEMIDIAALFRRNTPGDLGLSRDAPAIPRVQEVISAAEHAAADMLAVGLELHSPGPGEDYWRPRTLTIIRCISRCLTDASSQRPVDQVQIDLLKPLAIGFLAPDLDR